jgi:GntR family transcriptional regulator, histidine utilization repressor
MKNQNAAPLYQKVKDHVLRQIRAGHWRAAERIPSESELVREFKISRMTANRALRELSDSGIITRVAGVGTFVADFKATGHPLKLRNIASEIRERGHTYRCKVVALARGSVDGEVRERLGLGQSAQIFHSTIVHFENDIALQVEDRYVVPAAAPGYLGVDFTTVTPHEYLMEVAPLQRVEHVVRAVIPTARVRRLLGIKACEPSLLVERVTWSGGKRASFARLYHPGSHYELSGSFEP